MKQYFNSDQMEMNFFKTLKQQKDPIYLNKWITVLLDMVLFQIGNLQQRIELRVFLVKWATHREENYHGVTYI